MGNISEISLKLREKHSSKFHTSRPFENMNFVSKPLLPCVGTCWNPFEQCACGFCANVRKISQKSTLQLPLMESLKKPNKERKKESNKQTETRNNNLAKVDLTLRRVSVLNLVDIFNTSLAETSIDPSMESHLDSISFRQGLPERVSWRMFTLTGKNRVGALLLLLLWCFFVFFWMGGEICIFFLVHCLCCSLAFFSLHVLLLSRGGGGEEKKHTVLHVVKKHANSRCIGSCSRPLSLTIQNNYNINYRYMIYTWYPKQNIFHGCLVKQPISYAMIWNHPIETAINSWLFGVPGCRPEPTGISCKSLHFNR